MFFHPIQLLVCIIVAYGWHVFLTKKEIPTDKFEVFGRRLGEQDILLAATGCTFVLRLLEILMVHVVLTLSILSFSVQRLWCSCSSSFCRPSSSRCPFRKLPSHFSCPHSPVALHLARSLTFFSSPLFCSFAFVRRSLASVAHALLRNNRLKDDSLDVRQDPTASSEVEELV